MAPPETSTVLGEVFSAIQFYREHAAGAKHPIGIRAFCLEAPSEGIHCVQGRSLEWVDGYFSANLACEQLLSSIESGALPSALISHTPHHLNNRCTYTSAELLANSQETLMAAFGVVDKLVETASQSPTVECPRCHETTPRIKGALAFGDLLLRDWENKNITLEASSYDESLAIWASKAGFSLQQSAVLNQPSVTLEAGTCTPNLVARLSSLLRSVWGVTDVSFVCYSEATHAIYAPEGWCSKCACLVGRVDRSILTKLLSQGPTVQEASCADLTRVSSLRISSHVRIHDIISTPLVEINLTEVPLLQQVCTLLQALDLSSYPLSTPLKTLPSRDLALISIAVSLYRSAKQAGTVVIDLPSGTLQHHSRSIQATCSSEAYAACSLLLVHDPFMLTSHPSGMPAQSLRANPIVPRAGESVRLAYSRRDGTNVLQTVLRTLGTTSTSQDAAHGNGPHITVVPLFPSLLSTSHVLADELGIMQHVAQLYASSVDARCTGLSAKDFTFGSLRAHPYLCRGCRGLGVVLTQHIALPRPLAAPCRLCSGARFKTPVNATLFRNVSYSTLLNRPLRESLETLRALPRSQDLLQYVKLLDLEHLPLGMPVALLSSSECRRLLILKAALEARPAKLRTILIDEPELGFSQSQREGLLAFQRLESLADRCRWIEITMTPTDS